MNDEPRLLAGPAHVVVLDPLIDVDPVEPELFEHLEFFDERRAPLHHAQLDGFFQFPIAHFSRECSRGLPRQSSRRGHSTGRLQKLASIEKVGHGSLRLEVERGQESFMRL